MTLSILSSVIDIYSKCAWIVPLKNKKGIPIPPTYSPQYNSDKSGLERNFWRWQKIPAAGGLVEETYYNAKITEIEGKQTSSITGLATAATLSTFKNKIPNVGNLVEKHIMMEKHVTLLPNLIIINLWMKELIIRWKKEN